MIHDKANHTCDGEPSLTDSQVLEFCREGHLLLKGVVPDEINRRTCDYLEGKIPANPSYIPDGLTEADLERIRASHEPSTIFLEDWFVENVLLNPHVVGVMRSLLGRSFGLPVLASHHHVQCPMPAQGWHHDADHVFGPELNFVEVFYFPQDTPVELGPTELVPGSHIMPTKRPTTRAGSSPTAPPAPSASTTRASSTAAASPPPRARATCSNTTTGAPRPRSATGSPNPTSTSIAPTTAATTRPATSPTCFTGSAAEGEEYRIIGGQAWPWTSPNQIGPSYGFGSTNGYQPDWRKHNQDGYAV